LAHQALCGWQPYPDPDAAINDLAHVRDAKEAGVYRDQAA